MERAVLAELATVKAMRARLGPEPQLPIDAHRTAQTFAALTHTLARLRQLRGETPVGGSHEDMPRGIPSRTCATHTRVCSQPDWWKRGRRRGNRGPDGGER
jgi:hypothetical protein